MILCHAEQGCAGIWAVFSVREDEACSGGRGWRLVSGEGAVYPFIFSLLFCLTHV